MLIIFDFSASFSHLSVLKCSFVKADLCKISLNLPLFLMKKNNLDQMGEENMEILNDNNKQPRVLQQM